MQDTGETTPDTSDNLQYGGTSTAVVSHPYKEHCCDCNFCAKYCLFCINFLLWIAGGVMVGIGVWARVQKQGLDLFDHLITDPAFMLIVGGSVMFIISVFGCVGALRENLCLLKTFIVVIVIVFIAQVVFGIIAFVSLDTVEEKMLNKMRQAISHYFQNEDNENAINYLQTEFGCCGAASLDDWDVNAKFNCSSSLEFRCGVPQSCCKVPTSVKCGNGVRSFSEAYAGQFVYMTGCIGALMGIFKDNLVIIGLISLSVGFLELFCLLLANNMVRVIMISQKMFR